MINITCTRNEIGNSIKSILNSISPSGRRKVLSEVGNEFLKMTRLNFGSYGRYRGSSWAPLSKTYAQQVGHSAATDYKTGELYRSIRVKPPTSNAINIYTKCPYASTVAYGSKDNNTPARNFWPTQLIGNSPMVQRLTPLADRDLFMLISKRFNYYSHGALPLLYYSKRSTPSYGSPFISS